MSTQPVRQLVTPIGTFQAWEGDHITLHLEKEGAFAGKELLMLLSLLRPGDRIIDVGAHIGTFSVPIARAVSPGGSVIAIEANPNNYQLLVENIRLNGVAVEARNLAIGSSSPFVRTVFRGESTGESYIEAAAGESDGNDAGLVVPCQPLDTITEKPVTAIKIDVEGMDFAVLASGKELLTRSKPIILIEVVPEHLQRYNASPSDIDTLLRGLGYHFFRNAVPKHSQSKEFRLIRIPGLWVLTGFADILAIHPSSDRYPSNAPSAYSPQTLLHLGREWTKQLARRVLPTALHQQLRRWAGRA